MEGFCLLLAQLCIPGHIKTKRDTSVCSPEVTQLSMFLNQRWKLSNKLFFTEHLLLIMQIVYFHIPWLVSFASVLHCSTSSSSCLNIPANYIEVLHSRREDNHFEHFTINVNNFTCSFLMLILMSRLIVHNEDQYVINTPQWSGFWFCVHEAQWWCEPSVRIFHQSIMQSAFVEGGTTMTCPATLQKLFSCPMGEMEVISWGTVMMDQAASPCPSGQSEGNLNQVLRIKPGGTNHASMVQRLLFHICSEYLTCLHILWYGYRIKTVLGVVTSTQAS